MGHYIANLRDIEFCLFDLLDRGSILGSSIYKDLDRDTAMGMLEEVKRLAEKDLADSFIEGDRLGVEFNKATGDVKVPASFKKSYRAYVDNGWGLIDVPVELVELLFRHPYAGRSQKWCSVQILRFISMHLVLHLHMLLTC